jgi:Short C-terminal domain
LTGYASSHDNVGDAISMGNNTYSIKVEAKNALHRDVDALRTEANEAAASYCAEHGKELRVVSLTDKVPTFGLGYAYAKITFKALNPGDPELTAPAPAAPGGPVYVAAPVAPVERHLTTDELYNELVKLDDLRKKGILTDEEFQAEKKKLLSRSN